MARTRTTHAHTNTTHTRARARTCRLHPARRPSGAPRAHTRTTTSSSNKLCPSNSPSFCCFVRAERRTRSAAHTTTHRALRAAQNNNNNNNNTPQLNTSLNAPARYGAPTQALPLPRTRMHASPTHAPLIPCIIIYFFRLLFLPLLAALVRHIHTLFCLHLRARNEQLKIV